MVQPPPRNLTKYITKSKLRLIDFDSTEFPFCVLIPTQSFAFAVHLLELFVDLQRRPILGLRDVEPHKQSAAGTEEQKDEETEALKMLLGDRKEEI